jgi:hypothetical protein
MWVINLIGQRALCHLNNHYLLVDRPALESGEQPGRKIRSDDESGVI